MAGVRFDYTVKVIVLGDCRVGKSTYVSLLAEHHADDTRVTSRCTEYRPNGHVEMDVVRNSKRILTKVTDTGGQERFRSITASFYRGAQGCLLMFDAERPDTFSHIHTWYSDLEMYTKPQPVAIFLVGVNTQSHRRKISPEQAEQLATEMDMQFHELDLSPKAKSQSAVTILEALVDRIIIHASRLPSLTIDIIPHQLKQHLSSLHRAAVEEGQQGRKFKCSC